MINSVVLVGRISYGPTFARTSSGVPYAKFSIAVQRTFSKDKVVDFIPVVTWNRSAEFVDKYANKGNMIAVEGTIQVSSYQDETGKTIRRFDVVANSVQLLESKATAAKTSASRDEAIANISFSNKEKNVSNSTANEQEKTDDEDNEKSIPWDIEL